MAAVDIKSLSDTELTELWISVVEERNRRSRIVQVEADMQVRAEQYATDVAGEAPVAGTVTPSGGWGPGRRVEFSGVVYINTSGAWLSAGPDVYRQGWRIENDTPPTEEVLEWRTGEQVWRANDIANPAGLKSPATLRSYRGITYVTIQSHRTASGWEPPNVPALWTPA